MKALGLRIEGSVRSAGVTFYTKGGQTVVRSSRSNQPRRNTRAQFVGRQRMKHSVMLWHEFGVCEPMFGGGRSAYTRFLSLMSPLPVVYLPEGSTAMLLLPGMPVSEGTLPSVRQRLGEVGGVPALLTDLKAEDLGHDEKLLLYTAEQRIEHNGPRVYFAKREVARRELTAAGGGLALKGDEFGDTMKGWALVRMAEGRCSTQGLVTRCSYYERYTTEAALMAAAQSYGGLTE